jgi:hypothetical protein
MTKIFSAFLVAGGLLLAANAIAYDVLWGFHKPAPADLGSSAWLDVAILEIAGSALVTLGFAALLDAGRTRRPGVFLQVAVAAAMVGGTFEHAIAWVQAVVRPFVATFQPDSAGPPGALQGMFAVTSVWITIALVLLGVACLQAGFPKVPSALFIAAGILEFVPLRGFEPSVLVLAAAAVWIGAFLLRDRSGAARRDEAGASDGLAEA